jgi:hypothetical protein
MVLFAGPAVVLRLSGVPSLLCVFLGLGMDILFRETVVVPFGQAY